jgi:nucleotide-binding universal stress UspA family protein
LRVAFEEATLRGTHLTVISMPAQPAAELTTVVNEAAARHPVLAGSVAGHGSRQAVALYARLFPSVLVRHHVLDTPTVKGLAEASVGAELLIVGRSRMADGRSPRLSAVARQCVNAATCPVMIVGCGQAGLVRELVSTP